MEIARRRVGQTNLEATALGLGGPTFGGVADVSEAEARAIVDAAYGAGVGYFDTAPQIRPRQLRAHRRRRTARPQRLTDEEWRVIEPHLPPARTTGRPRAWPMREIVNAIFYVLRGGMAWRLLPSDFPPWSTIYRWFAAWRDGCVFERINHSLVMADHERAGREARPSAAIIDSQSVKTTEAGGPRGYDAGKKINGRTVSG
jgi:transposase